MYRRMEERVQSSRVYRRLPLALMALHFVVFAFVVIATPLDAFKPRSEAAATECASLFGWKACSSGGATSGFHCGIKSNMGGAAAFAIISIFVTLAGFLLFLLNMLNVFKKPFVVLLVDGVACATMLIAWTCIAGAYNQGTCLTLPYGSVAYSYRYGPAFGLLVTAWVFEVLATVGLLFVPLKY